ncbi:MAG: ABC transporter transmembrane domain-containing protein [Hyphomicrobiales bacterium]
MSRTDTAEATPEPRVVSKTGRAGSRNLTPLVDLLPYLTRYPLQLILAMVFLLLAAGATLAVPLAVRRVIDHGFNADNIALVNQYFAVMVAVVGVLAVASSARFYFVTWLGERMVADIRDKVFSRLLELSPSFYETVQTGEVVSRLTADTTQIKSLFGSSISMALRNLVMMIGAVAMMIFTSVKMSGLVLLAIPLIVLPLVLFGRRVRRLAREAQDTLASAAALAQESLTNVQTVQAAGQEKRLVASFDKATEFAFTAARDRTAARAALTAAIIFLAAGAVVAILWYGAQEVLAGRLTGGTLGQFVLYATLAATSLGALSEIWSEVQLAAGAAERLTELLRTEPQIAAPKNPQRMPSPAIGSVAFEDVTFRYPSRPDQSALEGMSFAVEPGLTAAIVGPSGAGKTTIFNLILRFYDVASGVVRVDGMDVRAVDPHDLRSRIAVVPQEPQIFIGTIADNIRFARPEATAEEVAAAADAARVSEFASRLPQGLDTRVGERGVTLSGGQRQRIAIARALLKNAPILLLDEATSALDAESETLVQAALERLMAGRTTLVIAHRLATVRNADRILVLDGGRIVASGSHDELMRRDGLYQRLAKLQFQAA